MSALHGVLYAEDFDPLPERDAPARQAPEAAPEPVIVIEPTYSLVELQAASRKAHDDGRLSEREEMRTALAMRKADALCAIGDALRLARADCRTIASGEASSLSRAILSAVGAMLPHLAARHGREELSMLLSSLLPAMDGEPRLRIRVHPDLVQPLRNDVESLPEAGSIAIEWVPVDSMQQGDICVKWCDGMMLRDTGALCAEIAAILAAIHENPNGLPGKGA